MNELEIINNKKIESMIYKIRGKEVMLDNDLAKLYGYSQGVKALNQTVKRNIERFPENFYFQLTKEEYLNILRSIFKIFTICFYRTRRCNVKFYIKNQKFSTNKYKYNASFCCYAPFHN